MKTTQELEVTLSKSLFRHLTAEARRLDLPIELLVASMVCDTIEKVAGEAGAEAEVVSTPSVAA